MKLLDVVPRVDREIGHGVLELGPLLFDRFWCTVIQGGLELSDTGSDAVDAFGLREEMGHVESVDDVTSFVN